MARVEVFAFTVRDHTGKVITITKLATAEFIAKADGAAILGKMRKVDESLLDRFGQVVLDPATLAAKLLRELDAEGEAEAPSGLNRREMATLAQAGLVTASMAAPGLTRYCITERGRQFVRDLLS